MGQVLRQDSIPPLTITTGTILTMPGSYLGQDTRITVGGQQYKNSSTITLNTATTGANGLDTGSLAADTLYYVYAVNNSGSLALTASLAAPATGPTGFTAWKKVSKFRTFVGSATIAALPMAAADKTWQDAGFVTGDFQGFGTVTGISVQHNRINSNMEIKGEWVTGTPTASEAQLNIPGGLTIALNSANTILTGMWNNSEANAFPKFVLGTNGDVFVNFTRGDNSLNPTSPANGNALVGGTKRCSLFVSVPIREFAGLDD